MSAGVRKVSAASFGKQSVKRGKKAALADHRVITEQVRSSVLEPLDAAAQEQVQKRQLRLDLLNPFFKLIESDPAAARAGAELVARGIAWGKAPTAESGPLRRSGGSLQRFAGVPGPDGTIYSTDMPTGINIFVPPYDFVDSHADPICSVAVDKATANVDLESNWDENADGARSAYVSFGLILEPSVPGSLQVRTAIPTDYWWSTGGCLLSSHSASRIDLIAIDEDGHTVQQASYQLWDETSEDDQYVSDGLVVGVLEGLTLDFAVRPGRLTTAWVALSIAIDQSGWSRPFSGSGAGASLMASVPMLVAELRR